MMKNTLTILTLLSLLLCVTNSETDDVKSSEEAPKKRTIFVPPTVSESAFFALFFSSPADLTSVLVKSEAKKDGVEDNLAKYDGIWSVEVARTSAIENDYGLVLKSKAKHHAIAAKLKKAVDFSHEQLVVQYEVKFQNAMDCGGAYVKLLSDQPSGIDLTQFNDKTPYTIMFGPDKCGLDYKIHFIFRHKNPISGEFEEKHAKRISSNLERYFNDEKTHLYTLVLNVNNEFEIYVDQTLVNSGNLLTDFEPSITPPKEVDDPNDKKPDDWDDREKIADPDSTKPEDWDESQPEYVEDKDAVKPEDWLEDEELLIDDPNSAQPSDWDVDMDGEWSPPKVDNPKCSGISGCGPWSPPKIKNPLYKGKWTAPLLNNPNYKGPWKARRIANPNYFEDEQPYRSLTPIVAIGLELWSMTDDIVFDNFLITNNKKDADDFAAQTWSIKTTEERKADPRAQNVIDAIEEMTRDRPWVWGIVALVVGFPVIIIVIYCCMGRGSNSSNSRRFEKVAERKKTDEVSPDDVVQESPNQSASSVVDDTEEDISPGSEVNPFLDANQPQNEEVNVEESSPKAALESESQSDEDNKPHSFSEKSASSGEEEKTQIRKRVKKRFSRKE